VEYLTLDDALYIHAEQLKLFGGAEGVRDLGLIESALLRPQTGYYSDLVEQAAALWESLAMNHGFIDGNKRVAFACTDIFLGLNGARLEAEPDDVIDFIYRHLEAGTFRKPVLDEWLRRHVTTSPSPLVGEGA
jgi:death-on-curing protein